jgi:hypothetical protein
VILAPPGDSATALPPMPAIEIELAGNTCVRLCCAGTGSSFKKNVASPRRRLLGRVVDIRQWQAIRDHRHARYQN